MKYLYSILLILLVPSALFSKTIIDRGMKKSVFIPKGQWLIGSTFSYSEHQDDNYKFMVLNDISSTGYNFKVSPYAGYFFRDNVAAGLRMSYTRSFTDVGNIDLSLDDDLSFGMKDAVYLEHTIKATGFIRTYIGLGGSKVFGLFNEARLGYGYGQGRTTEGVGDQQTGTHQTISSFQIGIAPGLAAFITNFASVEVSIGVMGLDFKWIDQTTNQIESGSRRKSSGDFKIDLFSINIGMTFYI
jgi:hypothetical protein